MDLFAFVKPKNELESSPDAKQNVPFVPEEMWVKCPKCNTLLLTTDMEENFNVCTKCNHHFRMSSKRRIAMFADDESFVEHDAELTSSNILDFPGYDAKLEKAKQKAKESVVCGECLIGGVKTVLCVMEAGFMMGSMGTVTGEKITRAFEYATENRLPVVICTVSGGARMQEGILSLMQMAKTSGAVKRHSDAGLLYITVLTDPTTGELLFDTNHMLMPEDAAVLEAHGLHKAYIRSVLTCEAHTGVCAKCYGMNLAIGKPVNAGEAVGVIAAQSIGEPDTQLTMRTFHTGGVAVDDITQGLPRVEELFEARKPKKMAILSETSGTVSIEEAKKGVMYAITVTNEAEGSTNVYTVPHSAGILVHNGDHVDKGQELTSGALNPHDVLRIRGINDDQYGRQGVRSYITSEVQKVYRQQGVDINDKHIEVIVRQMMRKGRVEEAGDTDLLSGATVDIAQVKEANRKIDERIAAGEEGLTHATYTQLLMGITKASLATDSWMSAASFQETTKVLTDAAIKGKVDRLVGLKENVIIGKLIPAGSGLSQYRDFEMETDETIEAEPEEYVDLTALVSKTNAL